MRPKLLDLFCGAGGAALGYHQAGYWVVGVDIKPQPHYPFEFHRLDAIKVLDRKALKGFQIIHASPPCQAYTKLKVLHGKKHLDYISVVRDLLNETDLPWIMENVPGSPLDDPLRLCGSQFSLGAWCRDGKWRQLRRHRYFESNLELRSPVFGCKHRRQPIGVYGNGGGVRPTRYHGAYIATRDEAAQALGISGMSIREMAQAIPPAYTEYLGRQIRPLI